MKANQYIKIIRQNVDKTSVTRQSDTREGADETIQTYTICVN